MAILRVKDSGRITDTAAPNSSGSFGSLPAAGNFIAVQVSCWDGASANVPAPTDNQSNAYARAVQSPASGGATSSIHYAANIGSPSGTFTITVDPDGSGDYLEWIAVEYSGVETNDPLDRFESSNGNSGTPSSGSTATTSQIDELVLAVVSVSIDSTDISLSSPAATGYTSNALNQNARNTIGHESSYKLVSATGSQSVAWTCDSGNWTASIATFKAASGAIGQSITGALAIDGDSFGSGTATPGAVGITGVLLADGEAFGAGTLGQGAAGQVVIGAFFAAADAFGAGTLGQSVAGALAHEPDGFGSGSLIPGAANITGASHNNPDFFGTSALHRAGDPLPSPSQSAPGLLRDVGRLIN